LNNEKRSLTILLITVIPVIICYFIYALNETFFILFIFSVIFFILFGLSAIHFLIMDKITKPKMKIEKDYYYNLGFRPNLTELELDNDGIKARFFLYNEDGSRNGTGSKIEKVFYGEITEIYEKEFTNLFEKGTFLIIAANNKKAEVNYLVHDEKIVKSILKRKLSKRWNELYQNK